MTVVLDRTYPGEPSTFVASPKTDLSLSTSPKQDIYRSQMPERSCLLMYYVDYHPSHDVCRSIHHNTHTLISWHWHEAGR